MNVFVLDKDIKKAAEYHCDKHIVKMVTETAQLLSSAYYFTNQQIHAPYKLSHANHPWAIWARTSLDNWLWLRDFGIALYDEYRYRFYGRTHRAGVIISTLSTLPQIQSLGATPMPLCMPEEYKCESVVASYRAYYLGEKSHLFKWTKRDIPYWIEN